MAGSGERHHNRIYLNDEEHHGVLHGYVGPQTSFNDGGFEVGESSDDGTNHNLQKRSPIGLNLRMSASFINQIESTLNEQYKENGVSQLHTKLKASNMPAIFLKIGSWQWVSENEGDLVVKFYYGKKKLVWEFLYGAMKKKIEIQWSQVSAINAFVEEDNMGRLEIELIEQPEFCQEIKFQPKKHTQWEATKDDFTNGQAHICRQHTVVFPPRVLDEPFKKLMQCDSRLFNLSQQPFPTHNYPLFQNQFLDFSCKKSVHGCSSSPVVNNDHQGAMVPYDPNLVQQDGSFVGLSSYSNLHTQVLKSPDLDEKAARVSYERIRTNDVWEQSGNNQVQEISVTPIVSQDNFLQNKGIESWSPSQLPEHTNESRPFNQSYQMNCMTSGHRVDQSYVNNGIALKAPNPWLPVEARVGLDNSGSGSSSQVMNDMTYVVDDETFINAGFGFQEPIVWLTAADYCLHEFSNGGNGNGNGLLNQMGYADNGIQSFDLSGGNDGDVLFHNSNSNSNSNSISISNTNYDFL